MTPPPSVDVVCLGESMVAFTPSAPGRLAEIPSFRRGIGGAESNVACVLARTGHTTRWISRVGEDGFGDHLLAEISAAGVDVSTVRRDPSRPTGVYFRSFGERSLGGRPASAPRPADPPAGDGTAVPPVPAGEPEPEFAEVVYYRAGSAAAAMSSATVDRGDAWSGRILHLSGITAALSPECRRLMRVLTGPAADRPLVSYDVNYRPALWGADDDPWVLAQIARGCDIVFVGDDEAQAAWNLPDATAVRAALPEPAVLVVKQGSVGATAFSGATAVFVPALSVDVVEPVGAGDAFAAGFLSATLRGLPLRSRLRHGHVMAAAALTVPGDLGPPPERAHADALVALDDEAWGRLRLGPGWTEKDGIS